MENSQRGFIVPLLLVIIALFLVGGGAYVYTRNKDASPPVTENAPLSEATSSQTTVNQQTTSSEDSNASNQMSGWKTYTNAQYGFSFEYPASFGNVSETTSLEHNYVALERSGGGGYMLVYFPYVFINQTTKQSITFDELTSIYDTSGYDKTIPIVGGMQSVSASSPQIGRVVYVPFSDGKIMEINGPRNDEIFDEILSTFKFNQ